MFVEHRAQGGKRGFYSYFTFALALKRQPLPLGGAGSRPSARNLTVFILILTSARSLAEARGIKIRKARGGRE